MDVLTWILTVATAFVSINAIYRYFADRSNGKRTRKMDIAAGDVRVSVLGPISTRGMDRISQVVNEETAL